MPDDRVDVVQFGPGDCLRTPGWFASLVAQFCQPEGGVSLDPCGARPSSVPAARTLVWPEADGLSVSWPTSGWCYVNPPYSALPEWSSKVVREARRGARVLYLTLAWTDRAWWHLLGPDASAVLLGCGRLQFEGGWRSPRSSNALWLFGAGRGVVQRFAGVFGSLGSIWGAGGFWGGGLGLVGMGRKRSPGEPQGTLPGVEVVP